MDRRHFFQLSLGRNPTLDVDCERLYMRYVDAVAEGTSEALLSRLADELGRAVAVRLHRSFWVSQSELRAALTPMLESFRSKGGAIDYA